jgi:hypothetical protein
MDERVKPTHRPTIEAAFARDSYKRGTVGRLVIFSSASGVSMRVFHAGTESKSISARDEMRGTPVSAAVWLGRVAAGRVVHVRVGNWPSGFYFAKLTGAGGHIGYAPFVLRPSRLGEHRVAVVLPTFTWQAYNFRDDDGDGDADTWYAGADEHSARLARPFENRGVPPHYKYYDQPFFRWLVHTGRSVDYLSDSDLNQVSGGALAHAYTMLVFHGHHEYVTKHEYDAVIGFRDGGGNLMFLSANNFFWRVDKHDGAIWRIKRWRELGRPEAALIGVQYIANDDGRHRGRYIARDVTSAPWIFARTGLRKGSVFGSAGIEIDSTAPSSPKGVKVLAEIPDMLGPGKTAQMTFYETRGGAKVFAAGAFTYADAVWWPQCQEMVENLWSRLSAAGS